MMPPFSPEDSIRQRRIGAVHAACGHDLAVFAVESADVAADRRTSAVWYVRLAGGEPRPLTSGLTIDAQPRVSPDGRHVAFLSDRAGGAPQVHVIATSGGEARRVGHFERGAVFLEWSPDGRWLLVAAAVAVDPEQRGERAGAAPARGPDAPELIWRLPGHGDGGAYLLEREIHLFALDVARGEHRRLTDGAFDVTAACWSPDGQRIAYTRSRNERHTPRVDLWIAAADGSAARCASEDVVDAAAPAWSPDGRWIVFTGAREPGAAARLWLHDIERGAVLPLGPEDIELAAGQRPQWQDDAEGVVAVLAVRGLQQLATLAVPDGQRRVLVDGERHVANVALAKGYLVYTAESAALPCELFASDLDGRYEVPLTELNAWWQEHAAPQVERRRFAVPDGDGGIETVDGWVLRPAGCGREATPWLVDVHDGPGGALPLDGAAHPHWHVLLARGWSVLALDAVGSGSYGREFGERLRGRWGELDLPQHLAALEQLRREDLADERVAIAGTGYGGFVAACAIGRSATFRAAVLAAPLLEAGTGRPIAPAHEVEAARTPTLILQGRDDLRCPATQAEALFAALLRNAGTPCELVLYPRAGHALFEHGRPSHRIDATRRVVDWLERWIEPAVPEEEAVPEAAAVPAGNEAAPRRRRHRARGETEPAH